jgi:hypothetical protein
VTSRRGAEFDDDDDDDEVDDDESRGYSTIIARPGRRHGPRKPPVGCGRSRIAVASASASVGVGVGVGGDDAARRRRPEHDARRSTVGEGNMLFTTTGCDLFVGKGWRDEFQQRFGDPSSWWRVALYSARICATYL